ncbi:MAG: hypothetical protein V4598_05805 [Bdellovibrionota bacterium]
MKKTLLIALFLLSTLAFARDPKIVAVATDSGGYPAKALCFFSNNHMVPHPEGLLVLYTCLGGPDLNSEIWLVKDKPTQIGVSEMGNLFSEPFVRNGVIYFFEFNEFATLNLWIFQDGVLISQKLPENLKGAHVHDFALVGDTFYFRYTNRASGEHGEGEFKDSFTVLPSRGPEFFWKASANGEIMLQKTKLASGEAVELRKRDAQVPVVILRDQKADPTSPFLSLRNQFGLSGNRWVSFARTEKGLTLIRGENESFTMENVSAIFKDSQFWPPALSKDGEVIFRGTDMNGQFALWGYKDGVKRLVLGSGQVIQDESESVVTSSRSLLYNSPVFDKDGNLFIGVGLRAPEASADFGQGILSL